MKGAGPGLIVPRLYDDAIPADMAARLHALGLSWAAVGRTIAKQRGREQPYQGKAVQMAVLRDKKSSK